MTDSVKQLEWGLRDNEWIARPESGPSYLCQWFYQGWDLLINGYYVRPYIHGVRETYTLDAAKAAAQADYERRILSALQPSPDMREAVEALEQVRNALDTIDYCSKNCIKAAGQKAVSEQASYAQHFLGAALRSITGVKP